MFQVISKLQQKPKETRKAVAFLMAGIITAPILAVWFFSLPLNSGEGTLTQQESSAGSPFSLIGDEFSRAYESAKAQVGGAAELEFIPQE